MLVMEYKCNVCFNVIDIDTFIGFNHINDLNVVKNKYAINYSSHICLPCSIAITQTVRNSTNWGTEPTLRGA